MTSEPTWFGDASVPAKSSAKANIFETMMRAEGGSLTTGQLYVQSATYGVTMFLKKAAAPELENYQVSIITIRMKDAGPQNEAMMFRCGSCNEIVFRYDRDVYAGPPHKYYRELPNIRLYADAVDAFNATDRICPGCGEQQEQFPQDIAGWRRYAQHVTLANKARQQGSPADSRRRRALHAGSQSVREFPERRKTLNVFREAALTWGSYDDFPIAPAGIDPAPHLSRNQVAQPFFLVTARDEVLVTMSGEGEIRFKDRARTVMPVAPGDVVYVPARIPARSGQVHDRAELGDIAWNAVADALEAAELE